MLKKHPSKTPAGDTWGLWEQTCYTNAAPTGNLGFIGKHFFYRDAEEREM